MTTLPSDLQRDQLVLDGMPVVSEPSSASLKAASNALESWALKHGCTYCGAPRGHWCRAKSGRVASYLHGARETIVRAAFWDGWQHGWDAAREQLAEQQTS